MYTFYRAVRLFLSFPPVRMILSFVFAPPLFETSYKRDVATTSATTQPNPSSWVDALLGKGRHAAFPHRVEVEAALAA